MIRKSGFSLLLVFFAISAFAQTPGRWLGLPVTDAGSSLTFPFSGGLNRPQFSEIDLDNDGTKDLFVFDRSGDKVLTFLNGGTSGVVDYNFSPEYEASFPKMRYWAMLADYNCDGKEDIFCGVDGLDVIRVYRNTSSGGVVSFALEVPILKSEYDTISNLYVSKADLPAFTDVDGDGDLDILTFNSTGIFMEFHQNMSKENYGHCDSLEFVVTDGCWGKFQENGLSNAISLGVSCKGISNSSTMANGLHAGSTTCAFDEDGDGDLDLLIGDLVYDNLVYLRNGGSSSSANIDSVEYNFPIYDAPVDLVKFPAAFYLDLDNDGKKDLVVAPNAPNVYYNYESVWWYRNVGTAINPSFELVSELLLQEDMIDAGRESLPVFFDYNGDGLEDLLIGNQAFHTESDNFSGLTAYRNVGTLTSPEFQFETRDFGGISSILSARINYSPCFGDLDDDGDEDLILGTDDGMIHYFDNQPVGDSAKFVLIGFEYKGIDVGGMAAPFLYDMNGDTLLDLVIGEEWGNLNYYQNIGTRSIPDFASSATSTSFGGVDVEPICCTGSSKPYIYEEAGKTQLLVGSEAGNIHHYDSIDGNLSGTFREVTLNFGAIEEGAHTSIFGGDLNGDGKTDWLIGNQRGGVSLFSDGVTIGISGPWEDQEYVRIYPNPVASSLQVSCEFFHQGQIEVGIYDLNGKQLSGKVVSGGDQFSFDVSNLPAGLYVLKVSTDEMSYSRKFIKVE